MSRFDVAEELICIKTGKRHLAWERLHMRCAFVGKYIYSSIKGKMKKRIEFAMEISCR